MGKFLVILKRCTWYVHDVLTVKSRLKNLLLPGTSLEEWKPWVWTVPLVNHFYRLNAWERLGVAWPGSERPRRWAAAFSVGGPWVLGSSCLRNGLLWREETALKIRVYMWSIISAPIAKPKDTWHPVDTTNALGGAAVKHTQWSPSPKGTHWFNNHS